ncbi:MAG TPA: F0F1 ATP synthase subunit A [Erysipelotrichaceae bacterium]|nr:F0F1 ATP synthase subunit A [Solobacterium sp.]HAE15759.1 F0F1 ATP synthase subunit A [Erysipelotrichaceae bacterium]
MTIQSDVYTIILETIIIGVLIVLFSKKLDKADPLAEPKGIIVPIILGLESVHNMVKSNVGEKRADKLTPYICVLWVYIFLSNIISLFGLSSPTSNLSVTLLLSVITWVLIQYVELKYGGIKGYLHSFLEPIAVMLPMNIFGKFSTMVSMSLRLFGNILCGGIMMQLIYSFSQYLSNTIAGWFGASSVFNFVAPVLTPLLHAYFDLFSGFIQTLVFVTLTVVLIGNDIPEEIKKES